MFIHISNNTIFGQGSLKKKAVLLQTNKKRVLNWQCHSVCQAS